MLLLLLLLLGLVRDVGVQDQKTFFLSDLESDAFLSAICRR